MENSILGDFTQSLLIEKHASNATRDVYRREAACFLSYLEERNLDYAAVGTEQLKDFLVWRAEGGESGEPVCGRAVSAGPAIC